MLFDAKSGVINQFLGLFTSHTPAGSDRRIGPWSQ